MSRKCILPCSLAIISVLVLIGCGEEKQVDAYAEVSLQQVTQGPVVVSKGFKYKLRNPEFVEKNGHIALIREGNIMEFVVGRSIADRVEGMDMSNLELNVVKKYTPYVHFRVEQIVSGTDTVFISQAGSIDYPKLTPVDKFVAREHDDYDLDRLKYNRSAELEKARERQFKVTGTVALVEEDGQEVWMLSGKQSVFRIVDPDDGVTIVLKLLVAENLEFDGGITFTEVEPWAERRDNRICGDVTIDFVKYLDKYISS